MKLLKPILFLAAFVLSGIASLCAEETTPSSAVSQSDAGLPLFPQQTPSAAVPLPADLPAPAATPATDSKSAAAPEKGTAEGLRQAIRIRELTAQLREDPAIQAEREKAGIAKTPEGRRAALRNYYTLLYTRMEKLEPALRGPIEAKLSAALRSQTQTNVNPSTLVEQIGVVPGSSTADHTAAPDDSFKAKKKQKHRF